MTEPAAPTVIVYERAFADPLGADAVADTAGHPAVPGAIWRASFLSADGRRLLSWFEAPDTQLVGDDCLWAGTLHLAPEAAPGPERVVVERRFEAPVTMAAIQAREDAGAWCLDAYRVRFVRTFFSRDRRRMICLYHAPDAESVRAAQHRIGMPVSAVWACTAIPGTAPKA